MLVDWFDGVVAEAVRQESPTATYLQQYITDRGRPRANGEDTRKLVTTILACYIGKLTGQARSDEQSVRGLEENITAILQEARALWQFRNVAGGAGIFCLLEEGFTDRYVVF